MVSVNRSRFRSNLGALFFEDGSTQFRVWAPFADVVEVHVSDPEKIDLALKPESRGYFRGVIEGLEDSSRYFYRLDGKKELPDPASRFQPDGVNGLSAIIRDNFGWSDQHWSGLPLAEYIIYELHVGAFSQEGTFRGAVAYLDELCDLGITAVELMPVAQFPGKRNWGYDGVYPYAVQDSYGGPQELKSFVNACHLRGLAVILDVVYNHLGPEGNYLGHFGPYFSDRYQTPWGPAVNFDGKGSDEVCRFFIENALYWIEEFHIDALRLDAVHAIYDFSARPFLQKLSEAVQLEASRLRRLVHLIAESSLNDVRILNPPSQGGWGMDAQWNDDFHHSIHQMITGEKNGYYQDYDGFSDLVKSFEDSFVLDGRFSSYRGREHGNSAKAVDPRKFVVFSQNHDQVGNRAFGERLSRLVSRFSDLKLLAGISVLSPYLPLLFMGEEYGEIAPFQYFIDHSDPRIVEEVRVGRKKEFSSFEWEVELPDPQSEKTYLESCLNHDLKLKRIHADLRRFYRELLGLRKSSPAYRFACRSQMKTEILVDRRLFGFKIEVEMESVVVLFCIPEPSETGRADERTLRALVDWISRRLFMGGERWDRILDSESRSWGGNGSTLPESVRGGIVEGEMLPGSLAVFRRREESV